MLIYVFAAAAAFAIAVCSGLVILPVLRRLKAGQPILSYVKEHGSKAGTPTMGGVIFTVSASAVTLIFCRGENFRYAAVICVTGLSFGLVGFLDDYIKIRLKRNEGLKPYQKIAFQFAVAAVISGYAWSKGFTTLILPFSGREWNIGAWMFPLGIFVFIATTNCVNLTDGLDGLAGGVSYVFFLFTFFVCVLGKTIYREAAVSSAALVGGILGFLVFNTYKAKVFMGDTGSLALGGFASAICILSGNALLIPVIGIVFVITGISVIVQVIYYKATGKRVFLMAPVHHHFQMKGASESKIAFAYKLITCAAGLLCVARFL